MKTVALKERLIEEIKQIENQQLLETLYSVLIADKEEEVYQLSEEQIAAIEEAQEEYRKGNFITHEEILKDFQKWSDE